MSDDLVKRLRERASGVIGPAIPMEDEAADRIEELKSALEWQIARADEAERKVKEAQRALASIVYMTREAQDNRMTFERWAERIEEEINEGARNLGKPFKINP